MHLEKFLIKTQVKEIMKPFTERQYQTAYNALLKIIEVKDRRELKLNWIQSEGSDPSGASNCLMTLSDFEVEVKRLMHGLVELQRTGEFYLADNSQESDQSLDMDSAELALLRKCFGTFDREVIEQIAKEGVGSPAGKTLINDIAKSIQS